MFRHSVLFLMIVGAFILCPRSYASSGSEDFLRNNDSISPVPTSVVGRVYFERRYTKISEAECTDGVCQHSEAYWSLVVEGDNSVKYLLKGKLNLGSLLAPETIKLRGVILRPGAWVRLEGQTVATGAQTYLFVGLQKITLIGEDEGAGAESLIQD